MYIKLTNVITYFDAPECIKISPKLLKTAYFPGALPLDHFVGWGLKAATGPPANLAKIVTQVPHPMGAGSRTRLFSYDFNLAGGQ